MQDEGKSGLHGNGAVTPKLDPSLKDKDHPDIIIYTERGCRAAVYAVYASSTCYRGPVC